MIQPENGTQERQENFLKHPGATPRQLVHQQIENFDYHVTDEDIANMIISTEIPDKTETGKPEKDHPGSLYDA